MCVIYVCHTPISQEELQRGWITNNDGGGVAWVEEGKVRWVKGLMTFDDVVRLHAKIINKLPQVWHFRSATHGGVCPELTHPFLVSAKRPFSNQLTGVLRKGEALLFHNGVEGNAIPLLISALFAKGQRWRYGKLSDTRAVAVLMGVVGEVVLEVFNSRFVLFNWNGDIKIIGHFFELREGIKSSSPVVQYHGYDWRRYLDDTYDWRRWRK